MSGLHRKIVHSLKVYQGASRLSEPSAQLPAPHSSATSARAGHVTTSRSSRFCGAAVRRAASAEACTRPRSAAAAEAAAAAAAEAAAGDRSTTAAGGAVDDMARAAGG